MAEPDLLDDRRGALAGAVLVGAVVVVLGFGSGFWSELAEPTAAGRAPATGRNLGTVVQDDAAAPAASTTRDAAHGDVAGAPAPPAPGHPGAVPAASPTPTSTHTATPSSPTTAPAAAPPDAASCSAGTVTPFWAHFEAAHLETSPGQQVADALDVDQYVQAHTVLVSGMLAPVVEALIGDEDGPSPFWAHVQAAHLETAPGQQVAEALDLDQYVLTHTVLVEDVLDPIVGTC